MALNKSGKDGKISLGSSDFACVRNWSLTITSNNPQFGSSCSAGHKSSVGGVKSATVSFEIIVDFEDYIFDRIKPGDSATLLLYEDETRNWSVPVRIDSMSETVDVDDGGEITVSVDASSNGAWVYPDGSTST